jgi:hypothetical protein
MLRNTQLVNADATIDISPPKSAHLLRPSGIHWRESDVEMTNWKTTKPAWRPNVRILYTPKRILRVVIVNQLDLLNLSGWHLNCSDKANRFA